MEPAVHGRYDTARRATVWLDPGAFRRVGDRSVIGFASKDPRIVPTSAEGSGPRARRTGRDPRGLAAVFFAGDEWIFHGRGIMTTQHGRGAARGSWRDLPTARSPVPARSGRARLAVSVNARDRTNHGGHAGRLRVPASNIQARPTQKSDHENSTAVSRAGRPSIFVIERCMDEAATARPDRRHPPRLWPAPFRIESTDRSTTRQLPAAFERPHLADTSPRPNRRSPAARPLVWRWASPYVEPSAPLGVRHCTIERPGVQVVTVERYARATRRVGNRGRRPACLPSRSRPSRLTQGDAPGRRTFAPLHVLRQAPSSGRAESGKRRRLAVESSRAAPGRGPGRRRLSARRPASRDVGSGADLPIATAAEGEAPGLDAGVLQRRDEVVVTRVSRPSRSIGHRRCHAHPLRWVDMPHHHNPLLRAQLTAVPRRRAALIEGMSTTRTAQL